MNKAEIRRILNELCRPYGTDYFFKFNPKYGGFDLFSNRLHKGYNPYFIRRLNNLNLCYGIIDGHIYILVV